MKGIYDIHTHIIPGVDDGADTLKTAKKMIRREYADGVRTIVLTPHFRKGMFEPPMTKVQAGYQKVQELAGASRMRISCKYRDGSDVEAWGTSDSERNFLRADRIFSAAYLSVYREFLS